MKQLQKAKGKGQKFGIAGGGSRHCRAAVASCRLFCFAFCLFTFAFGLGCRTDMHDQPRMKPLRRSDFFADQREGRPLVEGTVARGELNEDVYFMTGKTGPSQYGARLPFPLTAEVLRRGQERYDIFCSPCHSRVGDGNGMIVQRGFRQPPSFHAEVLVNAPLGHFYDVMTAGFGAMPNYAAQIPPADRWAIAAYIRALQLSQNATLADVPENMRANIVQGPNSLTPVVPSGAMGELPSTPGMAGESSTFGNESVGGTANPQLPAKPASAQNPPAKPALNQAAPANSKPASKPTKPNPGGPGQ